MTGEALLSRWARTLAIGRATPITPVDATSTSLVLQPIALAASSAISFASATPCGPVQAFAQPLFVMMALARPPVAAR